MIKTVEISKILIFFSANFSFLSLVYRFFFKERGEHMAKSTGLRLIDRIAQNTHSGPAQQKGAQRLAVVLAMKDEIDEALKAGWTLATICRQLQNENKFDGDYQAFRRAWLRMDRDKDLPRKETAPLAPTLPAATPPPPSAPAPVEKNEDGPRIISDPQQPFSFDNLKKR